MSRRYRVLAGLAACMLAGLGTTTRASAATTPALTANWYESAPYYLTVDPGAPDLTQVMSATGQRAFEMAFILAPNGGGCTPTWDGTDPVSSDTQVGAVISAVRSAGGDVSVSAGGFAGTKLGQACASASATAAAYQQVVARYGLHAIDFDLEEPEIENATAIANELGAAQTLQASNPGLLVTITMPATGSGANWFGQQLLNNAKALGFVPADYSIMPFDGGFNGASSQIAALQGLHSQLTTTFGWSRAAAWQHEGVSSMNGRTDSAEIFTQSDFQSVLSFATSNGMSRYTYWSVNRDRQCSPPSSNLSSECSSITQNAWDFTALTVQFAKATPTTAPPPPPPLNSGQCVAPWSSTAVFVGGDM
ncbi:MAG TPA: chitinase, partial [Candidatus Dormibacteraeota bacterium]|nr:chitinase [Candidatus Dormibacteraeota bacterium]